MNALAGERIRTAQLRGLLQGGIPGGLRGWLPRNLPVGGRGPVRRDGLLGYGEDTDEIGVWRADFHKEDLQDFEVKPRRSLGGGARTLRD